MKKISGLLWLLVVLVLASMPLAACGLELHNPVDTGDSNAKIFMGEEVASMDVARENSAVDTVTPILQSFLISNIYMSGSYGVFYSERLADFYDHPAFLGIV